MATFTERINAERDRANATTGKSDTNLHNAVSSLIEGYGKGGGDYIVIEQTEITTFDKQINFKVYSNADWTITSNEDWISVNPSSGNGNAVVTITMEKTSYERQGQVTFKVNGMETTLTITEMKNDIIFVDYIYNKTPQCYVKTGYHSIPQTLCKGKFYITYSSSPIGAFGTRSGSATASDAYGLLFQNGNVAIFNGGQIFYYNGAQHNKVVEFIEDFGNAYLYEEDGTLIGKIERTPIRTRSANQVTLFNINGASFTAYPPSFSRIYYFDIDEEDEAIHHYRPCIDDEGKAGLYDMITHEYAELVGEWGYSEIATTADYELALAELGV